MAASPSSPSLIDQLLLEQSRLSAVDRFSRAHEAGGLSGSRYCDLLPGADLAPGRQFAFEVDLDKCSGCKACVTACHALNGLDDGEAWREVGALMSEDWRHPFRQFVTTSCHHCVEPACLTGCPVLAYEKDAVTGVVRHLDDQCIGCQYCVMMCPYEVPKYSAARGIVRKCDLCTQRLAVSEAPACVQACPNEAIRITVVEQEAVRARYQVEPGRSMGQEGNLFLPAAPDPSLTLPTTRFLSRQPLPAGLVPADSLPARAQPAHWSLVWMLILTQGSVGTFLIAPWLESSTRLRLLWAGLAGGVLGVLASVTHLGRPAQAWRSFLGLRRSWLSREIFMLGLFLLLALGATWKECGRGSGSAGVLLWAAGLIGLAGVACSGMVYHATGRIGWRGGRSLGRFAGTTVLLGLAGARCALATRPLLWPGLEIGLMAAMLIKLAAEHRALRRADAEQADEPWDRRGDFGAWSLARSGALLRGRFGLWMRLRFFAGWLGGVALPGLSLLLADRGFTSALAGGALCLCAAGEVLERFLFFRTVVPARMPGV